MRLATWVVLAVLCGFVLYKGAACVWPHGCTEIGCSDEVSLTLAFADHKWPDGAYELEVMLDEVKHVCAFSWPEAEPASGSVGLVPCEPSELRAALAQDAECTEERTADAVIQRCAPLPGQYTLRLSSFGTPRQLQLQATRDGERLRELALELEYSELRPNGPDCEPLCRQSSQKLQLD